MTSGNADHNLAVIAERVTQLNRRADEMAARQDRTERGIQDLMVLPSQVADTRSDIQEIKVSIAKIADGQQAREQWLQSFEQQTKAFQESREQGIKTGMLTVIGLGVAILSVTVGVIGTLLAKASGH